MNLPPVTTKELLDQSKATEERSALWSQVVVRAMVEHAREPLWFPAKNNNQDRAQQAS